MESALTSVSPSRMVPVTDADRSVSCSRLRARSRVVLPEPEGPMRAVISPGYTSKLTERTAVRPEKATATSCNLMTGSSAGGSSVPDPRPSATSGVGVGSIIVSPSAEPPRARGSRH